MAAIKVAPSLLSSDFSRLKEEIEAVEHAGADWLHLDVMDGHFVPNITIGPVVVESIRKVTRLPLDAHLMIADPDKYAPEFIAAGADWVSFHPETSKDPRALLQRIHELGTKASIAVNPDVPLERVENLLPDVDMILMMTVFPGFGGQAFIEDVLPKIEKIGQTIQQKSLRHSRGGGWRDQGEQCESGGSGGSRGHRLGLGNFQDAGLCRDHPQHESSHREPVKAFVFLF